MVGKVFGAGVFFGVLSFFICGFEGYMFRRLFENGFRFILNFYRVVLSNCYDYFYIIYEEIGRRVDGFIFEFG